MCPRAPRALLSSSSSSLSFSSSFSAMGMHGVSIPFEGVSIPFEGVSIWVEAVSVTAKRFGYRFMAFRRIISDSVDSHRVCRPLAILSLVNVWFLIKFTIQILLPSMTSLPSASRRSTPAFTLSTVSPDSKAILRLEISRTPRLLVWGQVNR